MQQDYRSKYGEWALVMGGSQGLGLALATELGKRGMKVAITARRQGPLDEAAAKIKAETGVEVRAIACDAGDPDIVNVIDAAMGDVDIDFLIYNCAAEHGGEFLNVTVAQHMNNIAVNCVTPTLLAHEFGGRMARRGKGGVVLCSSLAAMQGIYNWVSYSGAKAYEWLLGEGLWDEFGMHGVGACAFMIGSTYTPNFIQGQKDKGTIFAEGRAPKAAPEGMQLPQLPEEAAENLFKQLDKEWLPLIFANPLDEARQKALRNADRATIIKRIGDMQRTGYRSSLNETAAGL
jgi:short-subunit dehydrogenase